MLQKLE